MLDWNFTEMPRTPNWSQWGYALNV